MGVQPGDFLQMDEAVLRYYYNIRHEGTLKKTYVSKG